MEAYLDNSATTICSKEAADAVYQAMRITYGNPSSAHRVGIEAEQVLRDSKEKIASTLKCKEKEIYFTSGATESNNWALLGTARAGKRTGNHIITTSIEHPSVMMSAKALEAEGFEVTYLPVDEKGHIRLEDLEKAITPQTLLVSVMAVNNETGAIEPYKEAAALAKRIKPDIIFHVDAVQAYGKEILRPGRDNIDLLSVSAHKIHGPKGVGFLYVKEGTKIVPFILGGGQQKGMRSGTDNVPGIAGLARAAADCYDHINEEREHLLFLKDRLMRGLSALDDVIINSLPGTESAVHIVSASFMGVRSEVMLHALEDKGVFVSAGSACSTNKKLPVSPVLAQLNMPRQQMESTLRFSLGRYNTPEEIDYAVDAAAQILPMLRRYVRR